MATILGISAFYHDSAAAIVVDGSIVAAAQEERFSRKKHDADFPACAVDYCLTASAASVSDLDYVVFYEKPLRKFERLLETYLAYAPRGFASFRQAMPVWLKDKSRVSQLLRRRLGPQARAPLVFVEHHESHAASAFYPSPFDEAAILTLDGVGEWTTTAIGVGRGSRIHLSRQISFPHSLGLLYSAFTYYCGFKVNSGEYKLMGLAPYGRPVFTQAILEHLIDLKEDGSFWMDMAYFNYCQGLTMTSAKFHALFGGPPRRPESELTERHMDLAASVQAVTEQAMLALGRQVHRETGLSRLVMAGGVGLNCVANGRLLREGPFEDIWVQPAAGDAGGALGAALFTHHQLLEQPRSPVRFDSQAGSFLGPAFTTAQVCAVLDRAGLRYWRAANEPALLDRVSSMLAEGRVVGWFQGRMEFGPRALGARSILGDPRSAEMQSTMNLKIKYRESFRPFAPSVLAEEVANWFDVAPGFESPYMLQVAPVRPDRRTALSAADDETMHGDPDLRRRVRVVRSSIPAVTHVDYSARLQTVDSHRHPRYWRLLRKFFAETGCPVLVNTSFNVRGEPVVCTPQDALRCFVATEMDALVMEDVVVVNEDVAHLRSDDSSRRHFERFALD